VPEVEERKDRDFPAASLPRRVQLVPRRVLPWSLEPGSGGGKNPNKNMTTQSRRSSAGFVIAGGNASGYRQTVCPGCKRVQAGCKKGR